MKADKSYVQNGLAQFAERIRKVADGGYHDWLQSSDRPKLIFQRTKANVRYDHIARHANAVFSGVKGVRIITEFESVKLLFQNGTIVVRFKHANENGLGVNGQQTQNVLAFIDADEPIPGLLPDVHKVECCFRENDLDTALESVTIVARDGDKKLWSYDLPRAEPAAEVVRLRPTPPRDDRAPPVVRPRTTPEKKSEEDS